MQHWSASSLVHFISDSLYLEEPCKVRCECFLLPNDSIDLWCLSKNLLFYILTQLINGVLKFDVIRLSVRINHIFGLIYSFWEAYCCHLKYGLDALIKLVGVDLLRIVGLSSDEVSYFVCPVFAALPAEVKGHEFKHFWIHSVLFRLVSEKTRFEEFHYVEVRVLVRLPDRVSLHLLEQVFEGFVSNGAFDFLQGLYEL